MARDRIGQTSSAWFPTKVRFDADSLTATTYRPHRALNATLRTDLLGVLGTPESYIA